TPLEPCSQRARAAYSTHFPVVVNTFFKLILKKVFDRLKCVQFDSNFLQTPTRQPCCLIA
ncbi:hypothetical protein JQC92_06550, partial [Shewanella sp. 202IG2-18]|uniref:hypothetical protein n=1 Tax=Parashewanella hymeniacidonis TaxID=2807618 RepID=UPI00195F30D6